tara:strand:- start:5 stop:517 length:513 start_codon:yes stop_codon:yes gene_type:complete
VKKFILITLLIFTPHSILAKTFKTCNVEKYLECTSKKDGSLKCGGEQYLDLTKNNLDFYDPPIMKIKLMYEKMPTVSKFFTCGIARCSGWVELTSLKEFSHRHFPRDKWLWFLVDIKNEKYDIYEQLTNNSSSPRKFLRIRDNNTFILTEPFNVKWSGENMTRISSGICN